MGTCKCQNCADAGANVCLLSMFVMAIFGVFDPFYGQGRLSLVSFLSHGQPL